MAIKDVVFYALALGWPVVLVASFEFWRRTSHLVYLLLPYAYLVAGLTFFLDIMSPFLVMLLATAVVQGCWLFTGRRDPR